MNRVPAIYSDAWAIVTRPELAAAATESQRSNAWAVLISSRGGAMRQRRRHPAGVVR